MFFNGKVAAANTPTSAILSATRASIWRVLVLSVVLLQVKREAATERQRAVEETKRRQWCANCGKEALFFCCWNTSYCDYPCQVRVCEVLFRCTSVKMCGSYVCVM